MYRQRSALILNGFLDAGHFAYVGLFESRGREGQELSAVLDTSQAAITYAFGGGNWMAMKERYEISGRLSTLAVSRTKSGTWVARRWIALGLKNELDSNDNDALSQTIRRLWDRHVGHSIQSPATRVVGLLPILDFELDSLVQMVTACYSPLDPPLEVFTESVKIKFGLQEHEELPEDLARRYREGKRQLIGQYDPVINVDDDEAEQLRQRERYRERYLVKSGGAFGFKLEEPGDVSFTPITVPSTSVDFMEYALAMFNRSNYSAYKARSSGPADTVWNAFVEESRQIKKPIYVPYEFSQKGRRRSRV